MSRARRSGLLGAILKVEGIQVTDCKYCQVDEVCVNADCPMCCDFCPVPDIPGVCRFEEREEAKNGEQP